MTLHRLTLGTYDPVNPVTNTPAKQLSCACSCVILPANQNVRVGMDIEIGDDPQAKKNFRYLIMAAKGLTFVPQPNDVLRCTEGLYRLLGAIPLDPAGDGAIIYSVGATLDNSITIAAIDA